MTQINNLEQIADLIDDLDGGREENDLLSTSNEPIKIGQEVEVTIVSIDAVGHSEMMKQFGAEFGTALERYKILVKNCIGDYSGRDWHWAGDGCICAFWGDRRRERAVLACLKILHGMTLFNLDQLVNPLAEPLKVRIAANDGTVPYKKPEGEITAIPINEAAKLEKRTRAGELNIYGSVFHPLDPRLKAVFALVNENFRGQEVFTYAGVKRSETPSDAKVEDLIGNCVQLSSTISRSSKGITGDQIDRETAVSINVNSRNFYKLLSDFITAFRSVDQRWSNKYQRWLIAKTTQLEQLEEALWKEIKRLLNSYKPDPEASEAFYLLKSWVINTHADIEVELDRLRTSLERSQGAVISELSILDQRIAKFLSADELDQVAAFVSLYELGPNEIVSRLKAETAFEQAAELAYRLWEVADLLVIEERRTETGKSQRATSFVPEGLLSTLCLDEKIGGYFKTILYFMEDRPALPELIASKLRSLRIRPAIEDPEIVLRALLAAHPNPTARFRAAEASRFSSLCQIATYPRAPLSSIWVLAERVASLAKNDAKKIFFDCVKPIITHALESDWLENIDVLGEIIRSLFKFDLFIEDSYFRELEAILATFQARAQRIHKNINLMPPNFPGPRPKEDASIESAIKIWAPDGVLDLPEPVQRHLAKNGSYFETFACHRERRIAAETVRFLGTSRAIEELLQYCAITGSEPNDVVIEGIPAEAWRVATNHHQESPSREEALDGMSRPGDFNLTREIKRRITKEEWNNWQKTRRRS